MAVNAVLWAVGLEASITADGDVGLVGPYQPTTFNFNGYVKGMKPADMAGWDTPIPPQEVVCSRAGLADGSLDACTTRTLSMMRTASLLADSSPRLPRSSR